MKTEQKSLELAKLMGWEVYKTVGIAGFTVKNNTGFEAPLQPYAYSQVGLAQFAVIILKFPEVMTRFCYETKSCKLGYVATVISMSLLKDATQESILDEILLMNGIEI